MEVQLTHYDFRKHPTIFQLTYILVAYLIWILVNVKFGIMTDLLHDSTLKGSGVTPILKYATYPFSLISVVFALYESQGYKYSILYALSTPIFSIVVFEILWHFFGIFTTNFPYTMNLEGYILFFVWLLLGTISYSFWRLNKLAIMVSVGYLSLWIAWVLSGYPQIINGSYVSYFFNFSLKILTFVLIMTLFYGTRRISK